MVGPAVAAKLLRPNGVVVDESGNLFITERLNSVIRKVDSRGIISTITGNGIGGFSGDDGPAADAVVSGPAGVKAGPDGNLYVADFLNHRIRKITLAASYSDIRKSDHIVFTEPDGVSHYFTKSGQHEKTVDTDTGVILYEFMYNGNNQLLSITDRFDQQITIERDTAGTPTAIISPDGIRTGLTINQTTDHLERVTYPDAGFYRFIYSAGGLMKEEYDPENNLFSRVFDTNGRITDAYDQEGGHWQFDRTVDEDGNILTEITTGENNLTSYFDTTGPTGDYGSTITDPTGGITGYSQTADERAVRKSLSCGMNVNITYDLDPEYKYLVEKQVTESTPSGLTRSTILDKSYTDTNSDKTPDRITQTIDVNGRTITRVQNTLTGQLVTTSPEGRSSRTVYDPDTLLPASSSTPGLNPVTYEYYPEGNLHYGKLHFIRTGTRATALTYDSQGNLHTLTDPALRTTTYEYDEAGRVTAIHQPDTTDILLDYDLNGNMTVLTNPSSVDHGFGYNAVNLKNSYQTPLSGTYSYIYDKDRRLKQKTFPSGSRIINIYDDTQLRQVQTPEGNIDFTYSCASKVASITKGIESITYDYDGKLITSETLAGTLDRTLEYTYDNHFNLETMTYAGETASYTFDNDGMLAHAGDYTISRYNEDGVNETGLPYNVTDGTVDLDRSFNTYGETSSETSDVNNQAVFSWNVTERYNDGKIKTKTETIGGATSTYQYGYDASGRLATVIKDSTLVEEYDFSIVPFGTCTYQMSSLRGITGRNLHYDDEDHLTTADGITIQHDLDGFLSVKTNGTDTTTYDYSSRGELLHVTLPDATLIEYVHDPLGRRIAKKVNGTITEKYLWKGLTTLLAIYDGANNLIQRFEYADGRMPIAVTQGGVTYYPAYDQVGSLRVVADSSGNVIKRIEYDSFGNIIADSNPGFSMPFGFAGGLHDRDTDLVRFGYRDYDPDTGRWTAKDPIGFSGGETDLYGYVLNDPINLIDPLGLKDHGIWEFDIISTAFEIHHYRKEVLHKIKDLSGSDPNPKMREKWKNLHESYNRAETTVDWWLYYPDEAIEQYRKKFEYELWLEEYYEKKNKEKTPCR